VGHEGVIGFLHIARALGFDASRADAADHIAAGKTLDELVEVVATVVDGAELLNDVEYFTARFPGIPDSTSSCYLESDCLAWGVRGESLRCLACPPAGVSEPRRAHTILATELTPHFADVQAHYDLSDDFFRLFLDPTQTYSCAYFERKDMTLEEAQLAKIDLALGKLGLQPGMTLLDVGCGWGSTMRRAIEKYDVNVVGLTLSKNQAAHVQKLFEEMDSPRRRRVLLNGWEQFDEPVDRIVSIGAFEHFGHERYDDFFKMAHSVLAADGVMLLHTITMLTEQQMIDGGLPITLELLQFIKFIMTEIFPGGWTPTVEMVKEHSAKAGFTLTRRQSLQRHYARTLDLWAEALEIHKSEAIEIQSEEVYERYMKYLTGCAKLFRIGYIDVNQFTLEK